MFTELMPLLRQRAVMITISDVGEGLLRVNIIPRKRRGQFRGQYGAHDAALDHGQGRRTGPGIAWSTYVVYGIDRQDGIELGRTEDAALCRG